VFKRHEAPEEVSDIGWVREDVVHLPAFLKAAGLTSSNGEGRRMIDQGAVKIDGKRLQAGSLDVAWEDVSGRVIQVGKRRFARLVEA